MDSNCLFLCKAAASSACLSDCLLVKSHDFQVIQTIGSLQRSTGGPARTVTSLADALGKAHIPVTILSNDQVPSVLDSLVKPQCDLVKSVLAGTSGSDSRLKQASFRAVVKHYCSRHLSTVLHDNGLWLPTNHAAAAVARKLAIPFIVSPRGMLEPWALQNSALKKRFALWLYQYRDLKSAKVLHATSMQELEGFRKLGLRQPVAVIPNGVELSSGSGAPTSGVPGDGSRTALFLSRIHPKKGLPLLIDAWGKVRTAGWRLVIAGPDEGGHKAEIEALIQAHGLEGVIHFSGEVDGPEKTALYRSANLFVLPTHSENFGVVVAEALSYGLPVITTKGAPWSHLIDYRCGWWVDPTVEGLQSALSEALALPAAQLAEMGMRGRDYVQRYDWNMIAAQMLDVYRWMLGQGDRPACIHLN
jgi:glycosyltransferase involved in cell wall biosynthesis